MKKKSIMKASAVGLSFCMLVAVAPVTNVDAAAKTKLNKKKITVEVGKTKKLKMKNLKGKKVKWKTSNKKVVKIKKTGKKTVVKLKGKKAGAATITAKVGKKKFRCKVTVKKVNDVSEYDQFQSVMSYYEWENSKKIVENVLGKNFNQLGEMERCWRLATWVCDNVQYDYEGKYGRLQTMEEVLKSDNYAVCGGYTDLYFCLLKVAGVDCLKVRTKGLGADHGWDVVKVDGEWYNCDITFMDRSDGSDSKSYNVEVFMKSDAYLKSIDYGYINDIYRNAKYPLYSSSMQSGFCMNSPYCTSTKYDDNKYGEKVYQAMVPVWEERETGTFYRKRTSSVATGYTFEDITEEEYLQAAKEYEALNGPITEDSFSLHDGTIQIYYFTVKTYERVQVGEKPLNDNPPSVETDYDSNIFTRGEY